MQHKHSLHHHLQACADALLAFVKSKESSYPEGWVPTVHIKSELALNLEATPRDSSQYGPKGWLFAILARMLEDQGYLEHKRVGSRSFCRSRPPT